MPYFSGNLTRSGHAPTDLIPCATNSHTHSTFVVESAGFSTALSFFRELIALHLSHGIHYHLFFHVQARLLMMNVRKSLHEALRISDTIAWPRSLGKTDTLRPRHNSHRVYNAYKADITTMYGHSRGCSHTTAVLQRAQTSLALTVPDSSSCIFL